MFNKIPNLINRISKANISYILINLYKIYIKRKFTVSLNYDITTTYYFKYNSYIISNLYSLIFKIIFYSIKYLYIFLDTTIKYLNF